MNRRWNPVIGLLAVLLAPASSFAQDEPKTGLVVTAPTAVGAILHVSETVAIRPDFSFSLTNQDSPSGLTDTDANATSIGVSVLFFLARHDDLGIYVTPRFSWAHSSTKITSSSPIEAETTGNALSFGGGVGALYRFGSRFGVFGEGGLMYTDQHSEGSSSLSGFESDGSSFGIRTAVGVALYF